MTHQLRGSFVIAALLAAAALIGCGEEDKAPAEVTEGYGVKIDESDISASQSGGKLNVSFTLQRKEAKSFSGTLRLETRQLGLDSAEKSASVPFTLDADKKKVTLAIDSPAAASIGDLGGWVLRYRIELPDGVLYGSRSLFMALKRSGLTVIGNNRFAAGETGALRVLVTDPVSGAGIKDAEVMVEFKSDTTNKTRTLSSAKTDKTGLHLANFTFTALEKGSGSISVKAGGHSSSHPVLIEQERQVLVTTDKPLYQPGQTVYIRALAMRQPSVKPVSNEAVLVEVEDPKGNKLFKKSTKTDGYGIAAFRFDLARLVSLGTYTTRITMGTTVRTKTFRVDTYTLPKFKVKITTTQSYWAPGATVSGSVQADYFFGKPVAGAKVVLTATDSLMNKFAEIQGKTDATGRYAFQLLAPQGGQMLITAKLVDSSGAEVIGSAAVMLTSDKFVLQLVPARKQVVQGDTVSFFALLTDPAGKPLAGTLDVSGTANGSSSVTIGGNKTAKVTVPGSTGLAEIKATVETCGGNVVGIMVIHDGKKHSANVNCSASGKLLRLGTDKALYKEGETAKVSISAPAGCAQAGLEVVRHNAVVHSASVPLTAGKGSASIKLGGDMRRTIEVKASCLADNTVLTDQRLAFVAGQDQLTVSVTTDKPKYRPAGQAKVTIQLKDHLGNPAPGAMGVHVVDEALYAMTEFKPGLERKYFFLEQSVVTAGKGLKFVSPDVVLKPNPSADDQLRARMLFTSAGQKATYPINYRSADKDLSSAISNSAAGINAFMKRFKVAFADKFGDPYYVDAEDEEKAAKWVEAWVEGAADDFGTLYKSQLHGNSVTVQSAGMDEVWGTGDDMSRYMYWYIRHGYPSYDGAVMMDASSSDMGGWYPDSGMAKSDQGASSGDAGAPGADSGGSVIIRQEFPETLYVNPALITDSAGKATIDLTLADSITTWKLSSIAHTVAGQFGSTTAGITVFQEFFVDALLPRHLVQNDEVEVPVAIYNYTNTSQTVTVTAQSASWFSLTGSATQQVTVPARSVSKAAYLIKVKEVGTFGFTVTGVSATDSDGVKRSVTVLPDGERKEIIFAGALKPGTVSHTVSIPTAAINGASELFVRVFPGLLAEVVHGLESLLKKPYGCFEQTSSSTYPNVLVLSYLKTAGLTNPKLQAKAKGYIDDGYQRLVKYEVSGGGFSLWGKSPANIVLSAFGLMEFSDMAKVRYVDPAIITRTQSWLVAQQSSSGAFAPPSYGYYEIPGNSASTTLRATAYTAWALSQSGYQGAALTSALAYLRNNLSGNTDTYSQALAANAFLSVSSTDSDGLSLLAKIKKAAVADGAKYYWSSKGCSVTYGYGKSMKVEATALVVGALLLAKDNSAYTGGGLQWLAGAKGSYGGYGTTQATILTLRTLLLSLAAQGGDKALGTITVSHNSKSAGTSQVAPATSDLTRLFDLKQVLIEGANKVDINFSGSGQLAYQVVGVYYLPHNTSTATGPLTFAVSYDKTALKINESIKVTATVNNTGTGAIPTVMMKVGLPPGFTVKLSQFSTGANAKVVNMVEEKKPYIVLYLGNLSGSGSQSVTFNMTATLAQKAKAPASEAWPYYTPEYLQIVDTPVVSVSN